MTNKHRFYDTCSLLLMADFLFSDEEHFAISSITLEELENIKTSIHKDEDVKYAARKILHQLDSHEGEYDVHIFTEDMLQPIAQKQLTINNDMKILATALDYNYRNGQVLFITNDLSLKTIATLFLPEEQLASVAEDSDTYKGYIDITLDNADMADFYSTPNENHFNAFINEYIILRTNDGEIADKLVWTGDNYRHITYENFDSKHFGRIKPLDIQQQLVMDSLVHNKITMIKGRAGSGKTHLSLGYLFNQLEKDRIDKIIVFCNTVATKNSAKLGFYPGSRDEKLLDSQIGNLLASKLGGKIELERLVEKEDIVLLPLSDIRGYDTSGMNAGIYISEAQNLDISLMKLALQRIGADCFCIIDGDEKTQVDDINFAGANNGMRRASQVFRGHHIYGEIELKENHRSEIGMIAEKM